MSRIPYLSNSFRHFAIFLALALVLNSAADAQENKKPSLIVQNGHFATVLAITYSPDERIIASVAYDGTIKVWGVDSGMLLRTLKVGGDVHSVAISPDRQTVAAANQHKIEFWQIETGTLIRTIELGTRRSNSQKSSVTFAPNWNVLAVCRYDSIDIWDVKAGTLLHSLKIVGRSRLAAFSQDGRILAHSDSSTIHLVDMTTMAPLRTLTGHADDVVSLAFSPNSRVLASGSGDGFNQKENNVRLWAIPSGELLHNLNGKLRNPDPYSSNPVVGRLAFSPDGKLLFTEGLEDKSSLKLWDVASGRLVRVVKKRFPYMALAMSPSWQTYSASRPTDNSIQVWDTSRELLVRDFGGQGQEVRFIEFSPNGKEMAVAVGDPSWAGGGFLWNFDRGPLSSRRIHFGGTRAYSSPHLSFRPGGLISAGVNSNGVVRVGNANEETSFELIGPEMPESGESTLSANGRMLAIADSKKHSIELWDLVLRKKTRTLTGHSDVIDSLMFNPDATRLATGGWDTLIKIWDTKTGRLLSTLTEHKSIVTTIAFCPDGRTSVSGSSDHLTWRDNSIKVWNLQASKSVKTLEGHSEGTRLVTVSPDGRTLASAGGGGEIKLWSLSSGALLHTVPSTGVDIKAIAFHPKGRVIVAGRTDGSIDILSADTLLAVATILIFDDGTWLVTSPSGLFDGSTLAWSRVLWRFSSALRDIARVEIFFNEFFYPDLLSELLTGNEPKVNEDIASKDRRQPHLKVVTDQGLPGDITTTRDLKLAIEIDKAEGGAQDVRLFRNGTLVRAWRGDVLRGRISVTLEATIPLVEGENRITAYAFNNDNIKSEDAIVSVTGAESLKRAGTLYVVAVGVNKYANSEFDLKYAVPDARDFGSELKKQQEKLKNYERTEVISLYNEQATKKKIFTTLNELAARVQPEDAVVVYFAGHGTIGSCISGATQQVNARDRFYLVPHDLGYQGGIPKRCEQQMLDQVARNSISDLELETAFEKIDAGQMLLVIDACNSGQALESEEKRRGPMNSKGLAQLAYEKGMYILTASQSLQEAKADKKIAMGHGYLTYALVEQGLKSAVADRDKNGEVTLREWVDHAVQQVPRMQQAEAAERRQFVKKQPGPVAVQQDEEIQTPRVFYRREPDLKLFVVAHPAQL